MTIPDLIEQARLTGIRVYLKGGEVKLAGKNPPDPELLSLLRKNKQGVQRHLSNQGAGSTKVVGTAGRLKARREWEADPTVRMVRRVLGGGRLASFSGLPANEVDKQEVMF